MPNRIYPDIIPSLTGQLTTDAQLADQGYTYNQVGFTYNQVGVQYGGIYNNDQYVIPQVSLASSPIPSISGYADIYMNNAPPSPNNQKVVGLGWWMYVSQV